MMKDQGQIPTMDAPASLGPVMMKTVQESV